MNWSITMIVTGILVVVIGFVPLYFGGVKIDTLETAASFAAVGILIFLVGVLMRRARRVIKETFSSGTR